MNQSYVRKHFAVIRPRSQCLKILSIQHQCRLQVCELNKTLVCGGFGHFQKRTPSPADRLGEITNDTLDLAQPVRCGVLFSNDLPMTPYYYVYRVGYGKPTIKHATLESAATESERLAGQHPGETFEILKCLGVTRTVTPQTFWMDGVIPPHLCMMNRLMDDTCGICGRPLENSSDIHRLGV